MVSRRLESDEAVDVKSVAGGNDIQEFFSEWTGDFYAESYDDGGRVEVFIDGACMFNEQQDARGGCGVWFGMGHPCNDCFPLPPPAPGEYFDFKQTNHRAALFAAYKGLCNAREDGINSMRLFTDSRYVFEGLGWYIYTWEKNGWLNSNETKVQNIHLWKKLRKISLKFEECIIQWVPRTHPVMKKVNRLAKHGVIKI